MDKKEQKKTENDESILTEPNQEPQAEAGEPSGRLEREMDALKDKYLRLAAEYDNFRKRTQRERESLYADSKADTVAQFLPVLDNIERAVKTETTDAAYAQGIEMISRQLVDILTRLGVSEIENKTFDPQLHNAVMHIEDESYGEGEIVEVLQKGYIAGEKVLRHSVVKVAN